MIEFLRQVLLTAIGGIALALSTLGLAQAQSQAAPQEAPHIAALEAQVAALTALVEEMTDRLLALESTEESTEESANNRDFTAQVRRALLDDPSMLFDAAQAHERQQVAAQARLYDEDLNGDPYVPVLGNPQGDITLVEFFDYNCGYCRRVLETVINLVEEDGNIRLIFKEFPILSKQSQDAALVALAAADQVDYLALNRAAMSTNGQVDRRTMLTLASELGADPIALEAELTADAQNLMAALGRTRQVADALGIAGTPAFYIEGQIIPGAASQAQLAAIIADIRAAREEQG